MKSNQTPVERIIDSTTASQPASSPLLQLLRGSQHKLEEIFVEHQLTTSEAEDVLREVLRTLVWKWETVRDRQAWLLIVTERRCSSLAPSTDEPLSTDKQGAG